MANEKLDQALGLASRRDAFDDVTPPPNPSTGRYANPDDRPPCVDCRLHRARIGEEKATNYYPELGITIAVPTESGGVVYLCPRCSTFDHDGEQATLLSLGILSRREIRRRGFKVKV